jgi:inorganic triphosphatase YgiF
MPIERELKFRIRPRAVPVLAALLGSRADARRVDSTYFDTPGALLRRNRMALRLRHDRGVRLQTLKAESHPHAGLSARAEWEVPVRADALELAALPLDEIRSVTGTDLARAGKRLRPLFATRFIRRSVPVKLAGGARAELCIDRGEVAAGRRKEPLHELEIELKAGDAAALLRYAERLARTPGLELAFESKAERGYRLAAGRRKAAPRKWRAPALDRKVVPADAFAALFSAALAQAGANTEGVLESTDPEYLHQLRVGLRRLRSALRAFKPLLPAGAAKPLIRRLKRLMPALGAARDWDVFVEWLEDTSAPQALLARARRKRAAARRSARQRVRSPEFQRFLLGSLRWLHEARRPTTSASLGEVAADSLKRLDKQARRRGARVDWHDAGERHALRIRIKRLRYAGDFFAPLFDQGRAAAYLESVEVLQELLGELNDLAVAGRLLRALGNDRETTRRLDERERQLIRRLGSAWRIFLRQPVFWQARR